MGASHDFRVALGLKPRPDGRLHEWVEGDLARRFKSLVFSFNCSTNNQ